MISSRAFSLKEYNFKRLIDAFSDIEFLDYAFLAPYSFNIVFGPCIYFYFFTAGVKVNVARVERRPYQFLYKDDMGYHFMHLETFEQISLEPSMIEGPEFLKDGTEVEILYHADTETPLTCDLPPFVVMEVTYTEPGVRGDTSSSTALKPATLETGITINVPIFVNQGEKIKVDTRTKDYVERVRS
ncbi:MAG TPA: elongation factor P [Bacteroides sp.]|nr:elongation factor P [Bacteroides sp.]